MSTTKHDFTVRDVFLNPSELRFTNQKKQHIHWGTSAGFSAIGCNHHCLVDMGVSENSVPLN